MLGNCCVDAPSAPSTHHPALLVPLSACTGANINILTKGFMHTHTHTRADTCFGAGHWTSFAVGRTPTVDCSEAELVLLLRNVSPVTPVALYLVAIADLWPVSCCCASDIFKCLSLTSLWTMSSNRCLVPFIWYCCWSCCCCHCGGSCCMSSSVLLFQPTQFLAIHSDSPRSRQLNSCLSIDIFVLFVCLSQDVACRLTQVEKSFPLSRFLFLHLVQLWHKECLVYIIYICIVYSCKSIYTYIYQLYKPITVASIKSLYTRFSF